METLDIQAILKTLPHRYPFLMIDRVLEFADGQITCIKNVTINEPFFQGHYPEFPVMPGVMILEALAQASGIMAYKTMLQTQSGEANKKILFAGIEEVRFKRVVVPGDQLILKAKMLKFKRDIWKSEAIAYVAEQEVCRAILLGAMKDGPRD